MASETHAWSPESREQWNEAVRNAPRPPTGQTETSVPETPSTSSLKTRTLGPWSLAGTLCADPDMRFAQNGKAIVKVRVAVSERHQDRDTGKWSNGPAEFVDVTVFGKQGEYVVECLRKGDRVVVNGIKQESTWTGKDEQQHTTTSLTARDIGPSLMFRAVRVLRNQEGS
jgi:single-strand DNA-binding protein